MKHIYPGAIHIHTTYSDGGAGIKAVAKEAKKAGLKWIVITDHNSLEALHNDEEGFYDGVAVIIGNEISPDKSDHYLAFDVKKATDINLSPQEFIYDVKNQGGFGFVAHPDESLERLNKYKPLRWTDWDTKGVEGIEIWNYASDWVDSFISRYGFFHGIFRHKLLTGPTFATMRWWDTLNNENKKIIPALGGVDAHALPIKKGPFVIKFADYSDVFKTITNLILLDDELSDNFDTAKSQILKAIKTGNNIIINRYVHSEKTCPLFFVETDGKRAYAGDSSVIGSGSKLVVELPKKAKLSLIYNGQVIRESETQRLELDKLSEGKYRIEVYHRNRPWIFSNPIFLYDSL